jgi:hypothetical protein
VKEERRKVISWVGDTRGWGMEVARDAVKGGRGGLMMDAV